MRNQSLRLIVLVVRIFMGLNSLIGCAQYAIRNQTQSVRKSQLRRYKKRRYRNKTHNQTRQDVSHAGKRLGFWEQNVNANQYSVTNIECHKTINPSKNQKNKISLSKIKNQNKFDHLIYLHLLHPYYLQHTIYCILFLISYLFTSYSHHSSSQFYKLIKIQEMSHPPYLPHQINNNNTLRTYDRMYDQTAQQNQASSNQNYNTLEVTTNGVCKKFIHGKCRLGETCRYPHDKNKIKPCKQIETNGTCTYGQKCNFSHDLKICPEFIKQKCERGEHCPFRHVYKSCPNFDMGYCFFGKFCKLKHIVRKLCWDYMYGFCEKGSRCSEHHPKIFVEEDFEQTKVLFNYLEKNKPEIYICNNCKVIGHKVNKCPKRLQIQPTSTFKCGLCGGVHQYLDDCNVVP